jgi:CTP synthase
MRKDVGRENVLYVHVTLLPYLSASGELKTKPTQHSVHELRGMGIQPDIIGLRADSPITDDLRAKVALFCDVESEAVIALTTADSIYEVPCGWRTTASATWWWSGSSWRTKSTLPN